MAKIATIVFLEADETELRSPSKDTEMIRYKFVGHSPLDISVRDFSDQMRHIAACHGLKQKISDSYAEAKGDIDLARGLVESMVTRLTEGTWNQTGEGVTRESLLAKALAEVTGQTLADCITKLAEKTKEERAAMRKHSSVKPVLLRLEAERAIERAKTAEAAVTGEEAPLTL